MEEAYFTECDLCDKLFETDSSFICTVCSTCQHAMEIDDEHVKGGCIHGAYDDEECNECANR